MLLKTGIRRRRQKYTSTQKHQKRKGWKRCLFTALGLWLGYQHWRVSHLQPDAIFVLGGHEERERFAAQLAKKYPDLPIWVSSGSPENYVEKIFTNRGIKPDRLHLDYQAMDTVTNFTTLVDELKARGIDDVFLVTSDNHIKRARVIGTIVFGSRGINFKPISVPSNAPPEPIEKCFRDGVRSLLWVVTGSTGEDLQINDHQYLKGNRELGIEN